MGVLHPGSSVFWADVSRASDLHSSSWESAISGDLCTLSSLRLDHGAALTQTLLNTILNHSKCRFHSTHTIFLCHIFIMIVHYDWLTQILNSGWTQIIISPVNDCVQTSVFVLRVWLIFILTKVKTWLISFPPPLVSLRLTFPSSSYPSPSGNRTAG